YSVRSPDCLPWSADAVPSGPTPEPSSRCNVALQDENLIPSLEETPHGETYLYFNPVRAHDHGCERASSPARSTSTPPTPRPAPQIHPTLPAGSVTVTHWYKQNVYDPSDNKIGEIMDVLVDRDGKVTALIVGAGGFLGMGEKDVAVPFNSVRATTKDNNKYYL